MVIHGVSGSSNKKKIETQAEQFKQNNLQHSYF